MSSHLSGLPVILNAEDIHPFKFYWKDRIRDGARYQQEIYGLVYQCSSDSRLAAYHFACSLAEDGTAVIVTRQANHYSVWVSLKKSEAFTQAHVSAWANQLQETQRQTSAQTSQLAAS